MEEQERTILALGFFDGVHLGHGALLERTKQRAAENGAVPAVLTFDVHPDVLVKGGPVELINSASDRELILRRCYGITRVFYFPFTGETARMDWRSFLLRMVEEHRAAGFVVGHDFIFGDGGRGNPEKLMGFCAETGLSGDVIPAVTMDGAVISSTAIRGLLKQGELDRANRLLGHPHLLSGTVLHGLRNGSAMEFPTANLCFEPGVLVPRRGVYASWILLPDGSARTGVTNVGVRPTFGGNGIVTAETHILGFSGDLYGQKLTVEFHAFLRPERGFDSPAELKEQIRRDAERAAALVK